MTALTLPARVVPVAKLRSWIPWQIPIFRRADGTISAGVPSLPQIDRDGRQRTDANGKRVYHAIIVFETTAARERWQTAVLGAIADAGITP